ncbi:MAG: LysR family transcriptional regulator [Roseibium sp.]
MLDIGDLKTLAVLAELKTYTAAARHLKVSHTTVARKVRELEAHFGTRLIERVNDQVQLTAEGEQAVQSAGRIAEEIDELERRITGRDTRLTGKIHLTSVDILVWHFMPELAAFRDRFPEIELTVSTQVDVVSLSRREAEVALRLTNNPEGYLFGREICRFDFSAYYHRELQNSLGNEADVPWLEYSTRDCRERSALWKKANFPLAQCAAFLPTPLIMMHAISNGMGVGALPVVIADKQPDLVRLSDEICFSLGVWLLAPEELRHTARIRALIECFNQEKKTQSTGNETRPETGIDPSREKVR